MESCYVPNNPHYGLQVEPGATTPSPYWSTDDMGSFSLPALDLDPLPSLFPFSPCAATTYKSELPPLKEKQPHDMADVLLSLKHAVVHPGQTGGQLSPTFQAYSSAQQCGGAAGYQGPSASLSYTVHPHQMVSPGGTYTTQYCTASQDQTMFGGTAVPQAQHHNMFPSMSVNVSMNMTMHGYPDNLQHQVTCPQTDFYCPASLPNVNFSSRSGNAMADRGGTIFGRPKKLTDLEMQWAPAPPNPSPVYPQSQGLLSPQAYTGGATYSFTADFRPSGMPAEPALLPSNAAFNSSFKPVISKVVAPPSRSGTSRRYPPNKLAAVMQQPQQVVEEVQRPNLCRICGKTYARPSTLKTHLRTHSGEKPYRCRDCNKSFSQAANLTAHVRTHSGEKPFRCPICDRRFSQSSSVTTHMRTHSGERPYRCRLCKKAFSDSSTLTKHLRIHSGEKPYQCKLCLLRFSQSGNLNRHMRVHGGQGGAA